VVVGAHGGAGCTTLAALLRPSWDMGSLNRLIEPGIPPIRSKGRPVVLICRNTVAAARHATTAVTVLGGWEERIAALVVIGDGQREPKDATARFALLEGRIGGIVRWPYIAELRLIDDPAEATLPDRAHRGLLEIRSLVDLQAGRASGGIS
jgi:hypothetical protein